MKKTFLALVGCILFLGLVAGGGYLYLSRDTQGPEIKAESEALVYKTSQDKKKFLKQFSAVDEKDGDVSDSLMLEDVKVDQSGKTALVTVVAMDSHHNVTKEEFQVKYKKGKQKENPESDKPEADKDEADTAEKAEATPETKVGGDEADTEQKAEATPEA